jgi:Domain of unknown function (DUF4340)
MADTIALRQDPRRRNLVVLAAIAFVTVGLAALAMIEQSSEVAPHYKPQPFLPGLAGEVRNIARIHVVSKTGAVDVLFRPEKGWVVASHDDYPAAFDRVRETIVGLASLETIEPKTGRADWLHYLDLEPPPKGEGVAVTLQDGQGRTLADVITGKNEDIGDPSGAVGLFVRQADNNQSWLARSVFQPKANVNDWLDKQVLQVDMTRIQEADVNPVTGPSYEVRRDKPSDADLNIVDMPKDRQLTYAGVPDGVAGAITGFTFDDVQPAKNFDFSDGAHGARMVVKTFDGLIVTVHTIQQGQTYWATISADAAPGKAEAQRQARAIDARASGWAYKLPAYKGQQLMTTLDSLLRPLPANPAPAKSAK